MLETNHNPDKCSLSVNGLLRSLSHLMCSVNGCTKMVLRAQLNRPDLRPAGFHWAEDLDVQAGGKFAIVIPMMDSRSSTG